MPDYENDLAFKPAMSWDELCEYAKSKGADIWESKICFPTLVFFKWGEIDCRANLFDVNGDEFEHLEGFAYHVTFDRMKTIIEALCE